MPDKIESPTTFYSMDGCKIDVEKVADGRVRLTLVRAGEFAMSGQVYMTPNEANLLMYAMKDARGDFE